ncbi:MAG: PorP/SprF family type IX secretion system membrane protein [Saprospiraceae bacterium]
MNKLFTFVIIILAALSAGAQQEAQYTHFMYNQQLYNPAYVGTRNTASFTAIHRSQWLGFEGAPNSELISFQTPIMRNRAGIGGTVSRYSIGVSYAWFSSAAYSYNIKLTPDIDLHLGLQATLEYLGLRFSDSKVVTYTQGDPSLEEGRFADDYIANVGAGMYLTYKDLFYFGASSPQIYPNEIGFNNFTLKTAKAAPHRYFNLGAVIPLSDQVELMPNMIVKWVDHAPLDADINFSVRYMEKLTGGLTYRAGGNKAGESLDVLLFFQFSPKIGAGIAYDLTFSDIRDYQSGTIEVLFRYDLRDERENLENPRYFKKK